MLQLDIGYVLDIERSFDARLVELKRGIEPSDAIASRRDRGRCPASSAPVAHGQGNQNVSQTIHTNSSNISSFFAQGARCFSLGL